ncbi:PTS sugar transporter subunit IIA [Neobacillus vireti]|uniref:PTS sugar transporter subunit IIA n=1 Tax=Neobacillus vireti TaxID=220686 RepID=UPI002FFD66F7
MANFIIATHGRLAEGFYESVKFFNSQIENVHYMNAYVEHNDFEKEFIEKVKGLSGSPLIVLTDIPGGSVNRIASKHMAALGYQVISGINLSILLELVFSPETINEETIERVVTSSREQLVFMNKLIEELEGKEFTDD